MYYVNGRRYETDPNKKLGGGSEGEVFPFSEDPLNVCVKLFYPPDPDDKDAGKIARYRAQKVTAITRLGLQLPQQFVVPQTLACDKSGNVIGYLMRRVPPGYAKMLKLLEPAFRTSNSVGLREIAMFYALIFEDLSVLHHHKLTVGDVNWGSNLFRLTPNVFERAWVDTDSWSYPGYSCLATTEMFCHPDLYPNLTAGGNYVKPLPKHDCFAYAVEFTIAVLPGAHPFKMGLHKTARSLQDRATGGFTIFDKSVTYPSYLPSPELLSDELLQAITDRLKRKSDEPLDPRMLREFSSSLVDCPKCGAQHHSSRLNCPQCHEKTLVDLKILISLLIEELYLVPEALLFAQVIDNILYLACRVKGKVQIVTINENKQVKMIDTGLVDKLGARYRFFGSCLAVCPDPIAPSPIPIELYLIEGNSLRKLQFVTTNPLENESAVFDTSARFLYRTAGNTLMCGKLLFGGKVFSEDPVTQVHQTQTWFTVDRGGDATREVIFGYDRALREMQWFVIRGDGAGEHFDYHVVPLNSLRAHERLDDFSVYFNAKSVLLVRLTQYQGRQFARYSIIGLDGKVLEDHILKAGDEGFDYWSNISGKLYQEASVLHVTPDGVVKQAFVPPSYELLKDTQGVITADDRLFKFNRRIGVARRNAVLGLSKKSR